MELDYPFLIVLPLVLALPLLATRRVLFLLLSGSGFLMLVLPIRYGTSPRILVGAVAFFLLFLISFYRTCKEHFFSPDPSRDMKMWRVYARPFALLFIPIGIYLGTKFLLYLTGGLAAAFILVDLYRIFTRKQYGLFFKRIEHRRFSSMTSFLVAVFIIFLLFHRYVAYLCLGFIVFGDPAGKLIGMRFGKISLLHGRTLEGSMGFLTGSLFIGFILISLFQIPFSYLWIGAGCATLAELFSISLDDNFTIGILTGACLEALLYFQVL